MKRVLPLTASVLMTIGTFACRPAGSSPTSKAGASTPASLRSTPALAASPTAPASSTPAGGSTVAISSTTSSVSTVPALTPAIAGPASPTGSVVAVLGDPEERYVARLGRPGADSIPGAVDHFARIPDTTCDQFVVFFTGRVARAIVRQTCAGPVPSPQDRRAEAGGFSPSDRVPGNPFQTSNGEQAMAYTSQALAAELPASAFHDCNGSSLPAGTFAVFLTANGWEVAAGTCP